jgi:hypothetical protein
MQKRKMRVTLSRFLKQYEDLVWYAQQEKTDVANPERSRIERIRREHPYQAVVLAGPSGQWFHGFCCGCLISVRRILDLLAADNEQHSDLNYRGDARRASKTFGTVTGTDEPLFEVKPKTISPKAWSTTPPEVKALVMEVMSLKENSWSKRTNTGEQK